MKKILFQYTDQIFGTYERMKKEKVLEMKTYIVVGAVILGASFEQVAEILENQKFHSTIRNNRNTSFIEMINR